MSVRSFKHYPLKTDKEDEDGKSHAGQPTAHSAVNNRWKAGEGRTGPAPVTMLFPNVWPERPVPLKTVLGSAQIKRIFLCHCGFSH